MIHFLIDASFPRPTANLIQVLLSGTSVRKKSDESTYFTLIGDKSNETEVHGR